jgi:hypothetical protein
MKKTSPDLFETFGSDTEFSAWEARINKGEFPTRDQLKVMLLAQPDQVLPEWILKAVILGIEGKLKATRGRRKPNLLPVIKWAFLKTEYEGTLRWLQRREKSIGLQGWSLLQGQHWWVGPPHERAARIVIARLKLRLDWPAFLNGISSH